MKLLTIALLSGFLLVKDGPGNGVVTGTVTLSPKTTTAAGSMSHRYHPGRAVRQERSRVQDTGTPVLVWLEAGQKVNRSRREEPVLLDQMDLQFQPSLLAIRRHETVRILNSDPVYHNVFSLSRARRFNVGRRPQGEYMDVDFDKPGIVEIFCDIHSNMHAVIYVLGDNVLDWTITGADQPFRLEHIPYGTYSLNVYAPGYHPYEQDIEIAEDIEFDLGNLRLD